MEPCCRCFGGGFDAHQPLRAVRHPALRKVKAKRALKDDTALNVNVLIYSVCIKHINISSTYHDIREKSLSSPQEIIPAQATQ